MYKIKKGRRDIDINKDLTLLNKYMSKILLAFTLTALIIVVALLGYYWRYQLQNTTPKITQEEITDTTLKSILSRGKIVVGTEATYPPMEYIDKNGNFVGVDIDIAKEIASDLGVKVEFKNIVWDKIFKSLLQKKVDILLSSITILPERAKIMAFSDPYFNAGQVIVIRKDEAAAIKGTEDLHDKRLGVQKDTTSDYTAQKYTDKVMRYETYDVAEKDLLAGKLDAIIVDYTAGMGLIKGDSNLEIVGEPFTEEFYGVAVRKEDRALLQRINQTIVRLKREGKLKEIESKWFLK